MPGPEAHQMATPDRLLTGVATVVLVYILFQGVEGDEMTLIGFSVTPATYP